MANSPFPADCVSKFPLIHVLGQISEATTKEVIEKFLTEHMLDPEFVALNVVKPEDPKAPVEGAAIIKLKNVDNTAVIPFGMVLAIADGAADYMIMHPQVFTAFYNLKTEGPAHVEVLE